MIEIILRLLGVGTLIIGPAIDLSRVSSNRVVLARARAQSCLMHFLPTVVTLS